MYQFVIPIHHVNWSTRSVLEGISQKYKPKQIYVVTSDHEIKIFKDKCDLILVNRGDNKLDDIDHKIFTRDIFRSD